MPGFNIFGHKGGGEFAAIDRLGDGSLKGNQGNYPRYAEAARLGNGWSIMTATAFAPVAALPTTTARLELWNNSNSGMVMIADQVFAFQLLSTAAGQTYAVWAMVTTQKDNPTNTALTIYSNSGRPFITTTAVSRIVSAVDTTVVANGWRPFGAVQAWGTGVATPGNSLLGEVEGRLIVPPGCSLCVVVVGSLATASTFHCGASWFEAPLSSFTPIG